MRPEENKAYSVLLNLERKESDEIAKQRFLALFPCAVRNGRLSQDLLEEVVRSKDKVGLGCALVVGYRFGFDPSNAEVLYRLIDEDWHVSHENIVSALQRWGIPESAPALYRATQWIPTSLRFDEGRPLAVRAMWALWKLRTEEARGMLEKLQHSEEEILRETATMLLNKTPK